MRADFNDIRHPWRRQLSGPWTGRFVPEFPWECVAVPVANWLCVSSEQLATTFPIYNNLKVPI